MRDRARHLVDERLAQEAASVPGDYWNTKGKYQKEYGDLWRSLVPGSGRADTEHGEVLRSISRIYHDLYNNGFDNAPWDEEWGFVLKYRREIMKRMDDPAAFDDFGQAYRSHIENAPFIDDDLDLDVDDLYRRSDDRYYHLEDVRKWEGTKYLDAVVDGVVIWASEVEGAK